jgi:Subtilase family
MAAPHVTGVAALLWAAHPNATVAQVRKAIFGSTIPVRGVQYGRVDAARALGALDHETAADAGALRLSRDELAFAVRPGRLPRAQTITVHIEGGGSTPFTAAADAKWILLSRTEAETPARLSVRVDPATLAPGRNEAHVTFAVEGRTAANLTVAAQVGNVPLVSVHGDGCELREGAVHARAGAGCALASVDGDTAAARWVLPDGAQLPGGRMYGQFVRRGEFQVMVSSDDGLTEAVPVVIE